MKPFGHTLFLVVLAAGCDKPKESDFRQRETKLYAQTDTMGAAFEAHRSIAVTTRDSLVREFRSGDES